MITAQISLEQRFNTAVAIVLTHEGGFSDDATDPGGSTDYGISLHFLQDIGLDVNKDNIINSADIRDLTLDKAKAIYKKYWWDKYNYNAINSLHLATKVFDMAVNMGAHQAHKLIQDSLNHFCISLTVDGIFGKDTLDAINKISMKDEADLLNELRWAQHYFYTDLVTVHPKLQKYLNGWLKRANY